MEPSPTQNRPNLISSHLDRIDGFLERHPNWIWVLFAVAVVVKLLYVFQSRDAIEVLAPIMDARYYDQTARDILAGNLARREAFFMGPLYPYVLAVIYSIFGHDFTWTRAIQMVGGATTVVLTYHLGARLLRPAAGLVAAVLLLGYGALTFYEGQLLMAWLGTLLNTLLVLLLIRQRAESGWWSWVVIGLVMGVSALARANILAFAPIVLWYAWRGLPGAPNWKRPTIFAAAVFVALLPATIHNYVASRDVVLVTSNAGLNFYIGNSDKATGIFYLPEDTDFVSDATSRVQIERKLGRDLKPSELSRYWFERSFSWIKDHPGAAISLMGRKTAMFFNGYELPQIENFYRARARYPSLAILFVSFWMILVLAVLGIVSLLRERRNLIVPLGFVLAYAASIIVFFITARYRVQIVPTLCVFAAAGLFALAGNLQKPRALAGMVLVALFVGAASYPGLFQVEKRQLAFREAIHDGRRLSELNRHREAITAIDSAIAIFPDYYEGYLQRAIVYKASKDNFKAIEDYQRALARNDAVPGVHYDLAQTLKQVKLLKAAAEEYQAAIRLDPNMIEAYNNLGITLQEAGRPAEAVRAFQMALEIDPGYVKLYSNLGAAYAELEQHDEAIATLQRAIAMDPDYPVSYRNLAMTYITLRQVQPAITAMTAYVERSPDDEAARDVLNKLYQAAAAGVGTPADSTASDND